MCGIAVLMPKSNLDRPQSEVLHNMLMRLEHRGPDGTGIWINDRVGFGMRRLTIVGGDSGQQPIWNEDHTVSVVCNGEIYNYRTIREELEEQGHHFAGESDAEVLVHLYETYSEDCVHYIDGIYAFAIWDEPRQTLLIARDRVGVKPLYFAETRDEFVAASEIGAILENPDISPDLGEIGLAMYHAFRFVPGVHTVFEGIRKLPPGHLITVRNGKAHVRAYWKPPIVIPTSPQLRSKYRTQHAGENLHEHVDTVRRLLAQAVDSQVAPDVKSSVLLSGGLDSTALLALLTRVTGIPQHTLTVGFERPREYAQRREYSELDQAEEIAGVFRSHHQAELISAHEVLDKLPEIITDLDEPVADPTAIPLWFVSRLAKETGNRVVFSGEGLDELFNGYDVYRQVRWNERLQSLPRSFRVYALALLKRLGLPGQGVLRRSLQPLPDWYQGIGGTFTRDEQKALFREDSFLERVLNIDLRDFVRSFVHGASLGSQLAQMTYFDVFAWLPENTLVKSDKISMAHSIELRVPFLDRKLFEYALKLPDNLKLRGKTGKWIIREAVRGLVPEEVLNRRKAGFPVPVSAWMFGEWQDFVMSTLLHPDAVTRDLYRSAQIERLFRVEEKYRRRAARQLWSLLVFEIWYQNALSKSTGVSQIHTGKLSIPANG